VLKTLSKRRQDRYQSAEEMAQALRKAAKKAGTELPERIELPAAGPIPQAPPDSAAVLSGTAREQVEDAAFAVADTDARLGQRLAKEAESMAQARQEAEVQGGDSIRPQAAVALEHQPLPQDGRPGKKAAASPNSGLLSLLPFALGLLPAANLLAILFGLITGWWGIYGRGWPFELLLVGLILCQVMITTRSVWLTIPMIIIMGNGFLFAFYALTNLWRWWAFLWPLEPMIILGSVWFTMALSNQGEAGRQRAVRLAQALRRPALILVPILMFLGAILG
jgi:hypothetical protein